MAPMPLIIDTDPGVDDMFALLLACASPEVDLRAVTTTYGNLGLEVTTRNARRLLTLAGRPEVPVASGASRPLVRRQPGLAADIHGADGLGGLAGELADGYSGPAAGSAVQLMADVLRSAAEPVAIAAIGPCTNVAVLLAAHPELIERIDRIVVMGGAISGGNTTAVAEFNIWCDPEAADRVFTDVVPTTMVGLDATRAVPVGADWLDRLSAGGRVAGMAARIARAYLEHFVALGRTGMAIHDAVTIAAMLDPEVLQTRAASVAVDCGPGPARGCTVVDLKRPPEDRPPVQVGVAADAPAIRELIVDRLSQLG